MMKSNAVNFVPLTIAQSAYFAYNPINPHHKNIARILEVPAILDVVVLQRAIRYVQMQHEALRLRFTHDESGWHQYLTHAYEEIPFTQIDLSSRQVSEHAQTIEQISTELQASLNLFDGPIWRVAYFNCGSSRAGRVLLIINHLVVDGFSFPIVLEDLQTAYQQISGREPIHLPRVVTSFSACAQQQMEYAQSERVKQDLPYWLAQPWSDTAHFPIDYPVETNVNTIAFKREISTVLSREETEALLRDVSRIHKVSILEILLTALVKAIAPWTGARALQLSIVLNGRNTYTIFDNTPLAALDLTRTVGYLYFIIDDLILDLGWSNTLEEELKAIHEQFCRMPQQGFSSPGLRYLCQDKRIVQKMRDLPVHELVLNYHGIQENRNQVVSPLFQPAQESPGLTQDTRNPLRAPLICQAAIIDHQLMTSWEYNDHLHRRETIEALMHTYTETLSTLIARCQ